jgi:hypothetical protein
MTYTQSIAQLDTLKASLQNCSNAEYKVLIVEFTKLNEFVSKNFKNEMQADRLVKAAEARR